MSRCILREKMKKWMKMFQRWMPWKSIKWVSMNGDSRRKAENQFQEIIQIKMEKNKAGEEIIEISPCRAVSEPGLTSNMSAQLVKRGCSGLWTMHRTLTSTSLACPLPYTFYWVPCPLAGVLCRYKGPGWRVYRSQGKLNCLLNCLSSQEAEALHSLFLLFWNFDALVWLLKEWGYLRTFQKEWTIFYWSLCKSILSSCGQQVTDARIRGQWRPSQSPAQPAGRTSPCEESSFQGHREETPHTTASSQEGWSYWVTGQWLSGRCLRQFSDNIIFFRQSLEFH